MRIGIDISVLNDRKKTGIAVYTYNSIDALLKLNKKDKFILFGIATFETYGYLKSLDFKKYPNVEMKIFRLPARSFRTAFLLWQKLNWPKIENFVGEVDIFHSFNWYFPPQRYGKKVATVYDLTTLLFPDWHDSKTVQLDTIRLNRIKNYADLIITISETSKKDFLKFAPAKRVEVVHPAVSDISLKKINKQRISQILKKYSLELGYILFVGTLEPRKNIEGLINAYLQSGLKNKLVLAGKIGWKNSSVLQLIEKNKDKIILTGYVAEKDLEILYSQALCFVYPSFYEGFGIPVLEAMSCGVPVITSRISSLPEAGGNATVYVDPYDVESIKAALIKVVEDQKLRKKMISAGFKQVQKFSWEKSAKLLDDLYHL